MNNKNKVISYRSCSLLAATVFYLQFAVSLSIKRLWSVFDAGTPDGFVYIIITQLFAVGLPCLVTALMEKADFKREFSLKKIKLKDAFYCALLGISIQPVAMLLNVPLQRLVIELRGELPPAVADAPEGMWQVAVTLAVVCIVPAFFEELLVRGMLLNSVKRYGVFKALAVTSLVFALLHNDFSSFVGLLVLGFVLGFSVLMTGSVFAGMITHFAFNATGVAMDVFMNMYPQINSAEFLTLFASMGTTVGVFMVFGIYNKKEVVSLKANYTDRGWAYFLNVPAVLIWAGYIFGGLM